MLTTIPPSYWVLLKKFMFQDGGLTSNMHRNENNIIFYKYFNSIDKQQLPVQGLWRTLIPDIYQRVVDNALARQFLGNLLMNTNANINCRCKLFLFHRIKHNLTNLKRTAYVRNKTSQNSPIMLISGHLRKSVFFSVSASFCSVFSAVCPVYINKLLTSPSTI